MTRKLELPDLAAKLIAGARDNEQVEICVSRNRSTTVKAYSGQVESVRSGLSEAAGIRVIVDGRQGFASAGSLDYQVLNQLLDEARENLNFAEPDPYQGIAAPDGVVPPNLDLSDPTILQITEDQRSTVAIELEQRCLDSDPRVKSVRSAAWSDGWGEFALVSTSGISVYSEGGSCSVGVQPLAVDGEETQIGYAGDAARRTDLLDLDRVVSEAVEGATGMLGATKPESKQLTVVFEPSVTAAFLGTIAGALTGDRVIKGRSPFADRLGEKIASSQLGLFDDPTNIESLGADNHDGEGLATRKNNLIDSGVLSNFLHNSYTARRAGAQSTGSAVRGPRSTPGVGIHALCMTPGAGDRNDLFAQIGSGVFVRGVNGLHSGVNPVSGDFSVGAYGQHIKDGALGAPFREATIASTLQKMLLDVVAIGGDFEFLPSGSGVASMAIADVALSGT